MPQTILQGNFPSALLPIFNEWVDETRSILTPLTPQIYTVEQTKQSIEIIGTSMGLPLFSDMTESGALKYGSDQELYKPRFEQRLWGAGFQLSLMARIFNTYLRDGKRQIKQLTTNAETTKDLLASQLINNASSSASAQPGGDGQPLGSASHTSPVGSQSNLVAIDMSEGSLTAINTLIRKVQNNRGRPMNLRPQAILSSVDLEDEITRLTMSTGRPGTPDNDPNVNKGRFPKGNITHPFITSTTAYVVTTDAPDGMMCYVGYESAVENDTNFDTKNMSFSQVFCRAYGFVDWRCAVVSTGD